MDEDVEDIVGDVKYSESQKSMAASAAYSQDFTDSSSDKNNSSGKETYTIAFDSDDSTKTFQLHNNESILNFMDATNINFRHDTDNGTTIYSIDQSIGSNMNLNKSNGQETFTQTSKTIMELAQSEPLMKKPTDTLETQTSFVSIAENKTVEYTIQVIETKPKINHKVVKLPDNLLCKIVQNLPHDDPILVKSKKGRLSPSLNTNIETLNLNNSNGETIDFIDDDSKEDLIHSYQNDTQYETTDIDSSKYDSDIEDDSLEKVYQEKKGTDEDSSETSEVPNSIDQDVEELYNKLNESPLLLSPVSAEPLVRNLSILTPLTEVTARKENMDMSPSVVTLTQNADEETIFINNGVRVKMLPDNVRSIEENEFKLPPIMSQSGPHSPHLNCLFSLHPKSSGRGAFSLNEGYNSKLLDRWELGTRELASGESPLITGRSDSVKSSKDLLRLPPIHLEGFFCNTVTNTRANIPTNLENSNNQPFDLISINGKIKELKLNKKSRIPKYESRSASPNSLSSPNESRISEATERGCEALSCELLRKLRSSSWVEVNETLEDLPKTLSKLWSVISENRIADLLRRVTGHIESPRTQVARAACTTLAEILKNTNYTKKPDFYEAISSLLTKTGSYNRPVRRAANVALDDVVSSVDITHSVTAICIYGVGHKNALVRSASARLLVVCCALAEGGRQILRARPPTAAAARRHALRAMAELLQDRTIETRKYAERLYKMLRPLQSFEAYFLTDVDVELATRHMKKYDQLLRTKQTT